MSFAVVTGASSGIGEVFARRLAGRGYDLVVAARRRDRLEALADPFRAEGRRVDVMAVDLATAAGRDALWEHAAGLGAPVNLLVNNAGFGLAGRFARLDRVRQLEMVTLNVTALTDLAHRFLGPMLELGHGAIINVASLAGFQPVPYLGVYAATKAYVLSLSEALEEETRGSGVSVVALCPGPVPTEFQSIAGTSLAGAARHVATTAEQCVDETLAGLEAGHAVVVPGIHNRLLAASVGFFPRRAVTRVAGSVYRRRIGDR
jgi:short-subunit dehydrogenase